MHGAIENNTLMMETYRGKPVSRYAVVTVHDIHQIANRYLIFYGGMSTNLVIGWSPYAILRLETWPKSLEAWFKR